MIRPYRIILPENVIVTIKSGGGKILLAATNIIFGKIKDENGKEQRGWTAMLTMKGKDKRETQKAFKINAGTKIQFEKIALQILDIDRGRNGMYVDAAIESAD